jgi:hypothetical protein
LEVLLTFFRHCQHFFSIFFRKFANIFSQHFFRIVTNIFSSTFFRSVAKHFFVHILEILPTFFLVNIFRDQHFLINILKKYWFRELFFVNIFQNVATFLKNVGHHFSPFY